MQKFIDIAEFERSETPIGTPLSKNLRQLMKQHNKITETELARQINIPQPTVHKILSGRTADPRVSTLRLLAEYFDVSIEQMLGVKAEPIAKVRSVPVIEWKEAVNWNDTINQLTTNHHEWVAVENAPNVCFALTSRPSMEPRFPRGTIFMVNPELAPRDGDLIIVHYPGSDESTLRELTMDGPNKFLMPIISSTNHDQLTDNIHVIGVVIKYKFSYYD